MHENNRHRIRSKTKHLLLFIHALVKAICFTKSFGLRLLLKKVEGSSIDSNVDTIPLGNFQKQA